MTTTRRASPDDIPSVTTSAIEPAKAAEGDLWISYWYDVSYLRLHTVVKRWVPPFGATKGRWEKLEAPR